MSRSANSSRTNDSDAALFTFNERAVTWQIVDYGREFILLLLSHFTSSRNQDCCEKHQVRLSSFVDAKNEVTGKEALFLVIKNILQNLTT